MGLLERTMRNEMRHRMLYGRRRRRTGMWGSPGMITAGALAAALATRRWRG